MENRTKLSNEKGNTPKRKKIRKKTMIRSVFLLLFLLGINTFAWFTYISRAEVSINGSVVSWDVNFLDENGAVEDMDIEITEMQPGMIPFEKKIEIVNNSDVGARFSYQINSVSILGIEILQRELNETIINSLQNDYPFILRIIPGKTELAIGDATNFQVTMNWSYEEQEKYYRLNSIYSYDPSIYYYTFTNNTYQIDQTVTADNFASKVETGLYLAKDDADSFFGYQCGNYEQNTGQPCIKIGLELRVSQLEN